jgi:hypothetical protein
MQGDRDIWVDEADIIVLCPLGPNSDLIACRGVEGIGTGYIFVDNWLIDDERSEDGEA